VPLIDPAAPSFLLNQDELDATHREFAELVNALAEANGNAFVQLFTRLCEHCTAHFAREKELMQSSAFPSLAEHDSEHQRILGELKQYQRKVNKGAISFARAYVKDRLPEWFQLHLSTMDSALAYHLKQQAA
jgi:hemerythrin